MVYFIPGGNCESVAMKIYTDSLTQNLICKEYEATCWDDGYRQKG